MDRTTTEKLTDPKLFERLVAKAEALLEEKFWGSGALPGGATSETIALDAIEGVILGTSTWDQEKYPNPYPVLAGMVRSRISNLVRSAANRLGAQLLLSKDEPYCEVVHDDYLLLQKIEAEVAHDSELLAYVRVAQIHSKREHIAQALGVAADEVTNLQKRTRRVFKGRAKEFGIDAIAGEDE